MESLTPEEVRRLLGVIDESSYTGFRTKVIVFVLLDTMVRVSELVDIKRQNIDLKHGLIQLEASDTKTRVAREYAVLENHQNAGRLFTGNGRFRE